MNLIICVLVSLLMVSCISRKEKTELKSPLEVLSGQAYGVTGEAPAGSQEGVWKGTGAAPIMGTKNQITRVRGKLMIGDGITATPLKFTDVRLLNDEGKVVANATSDITGAFVLSGTLFNGHYTVDVASPKYVGASRIYINRYDMDTTIHVTAKP